MSVWTFGFQEAWKPSGTGSGSAIQAPHASRVGQRSIKTFHDRTRVQIAARTGHGSDRSRSLPSQTQPPRASHVGHLPSARPRTLLTHRRPAAACLGRRLDSGGECQAKRTEFPPRRVIMTGTGWLRPLLGHFAWQSVAARGAASHAHGSRHEVGQQAGAKKPSRLHGSERLEPSSSRVRQLGACRRSSPSHGPSQPLGLPPGLRHVRGETCACQSLPRLQKAACFRGA